MQGLIAYRPSLRSQSKHARQDPGRGMEGKFLTGTCLLALHGSLSLLFYVTKDDLLIDDSTHSELDPSTSVIKNKMPLTHVYRPI